MRSYADDLGNRYIQLKEKMLVLKNSSIHFRFVLHLSHLRGEEGMYRAGPDGIDGTYGGTE
jgi:hypothetical protein